MGRKSHKLDPMTPVDQYPDLSQPYDLTEAQIESYQDKGHILLRGVAKSREVQAYRKLITRSTEELAKSYKPMHERDTYGKAFIQNMNLWVGDEGVRRYTLATRFGKIAADLMGVDGVRLYHDQALYKEAGGGPTPWHQDQQYWPLDGVKCVTMWMPLVDAKADMGTMRFADGSQELGYLGAMNISDDSDNFLEALIATRGYNIAFAGDMSAGDATFHNGWTIHGACGNASTTTTREVMTVIYFEAGAVLTPPDSESRESDLATWFPGLKAGDLAASELNPVVWQKSF
jgi:ectoine hydroxylase-related dioxygenase (phytanoyl-CoA dioxygenase family)